MDLQWPHQGAQQSMTTPVLWAITSRSKVLSVTITGVVVTDDVSRGLLQRPHTGPSLMRTTGMRFFVPQLLQITMALFGIFHPPFSVPGVPLARKKTTHFKARIIVS
jgi:hypothetical protein